MLVNNFIMSLISSWLHYTEWYKAFVHHTSLIQASAQLAAWLRLWEHHWNAWSVLWWHEKNKNRKNTPQLSSRWTLSCFQQKVRCFLLSFYWKETKKGRASWGLFQKGGRANFKTLEFLVPEKLIWVSSNQIWVVLLWVCASQTWKADMNGALLL